MTTRVRTTTAVLALSGALALAGCESSSSSSAAPAQGSGEGGPRSGTIAFLMPDLASTRYEQQDRPLFEAKVAELCPDCDVFYANADADAAQQQQQANSALAQGVAAIVLDAVDSAAAASIVASAQAQQVPVIAYDRPVPDRPADYYVSFDNEAIGASIAQSLVDELRRRGVQGGLLQVNGSPTDAAAGLIRDGVSGVVDASGFPVLAEFDTPGWQPPDAQNFVAGQITRFRDEIVGVVAANDGTGGAAIAAFKAAGIAPVPPVTGNDAEVAAVQRIISGDQYNTISKPIRIVAEAAAEIAYAFVQGERPAGETTLFDTPTRLFQPTVVTRENLKQVVVDGGIYTAEQLCTAEYAAGCAELGLR